MATTTNYGWTTPDDTALVKDGAAAIRTLGSSVDTTTKNLNPETTLGDISYRSSTANVNTRLPLGTAGQVLKVNSGATAPEWATDASGMTNPMTTTGDTIYSSSGSTPARLPIGSTGNVLTVAGGVPTWAAPAGGAFVGASLYDTTATQSISNNTSTLITWDSENFDTNTYHSTSSNTSRITIPAGKAGKYLFTSYGFFADNATGNRRLDLRKNGSLIRSWPTPSTTATFSGLTITCILNLAEADYIEIAVFQSSGGSLNYYKGIDTGNQYGTFDCQYLGA